MVTLKISKLLTPVIIFSL